MADALTPSSLLMMLGQILGPAMFGAKPGAAASPIGGGVPGLSAQAPMPQQQAPSQAMPAAGIPGQAGAASLGGLPGPPQPEEPTGLMGALLSPASQGILGGLMGMMQGAQSHGGVLPIVLSALAGGLQGYGGEEDQLRKEQQQQFENAMKYDEYKQKASIGMANAQRMIDHDPIWKQSGWSPEDLAPLSMQEADSHAQTLQTHFDTVQEQKARAEQGHQQFEQGQQLQKELGEGRLDIAKGMEGIAAGNAALRGETAAATEAQRGFTNEMTREHLTLDQRNAANAETDRKQKQAQDLTVKVDTLGKAHNPSPSTHAYGGYDASANEFFYDPLPTDYRSYPQMRVKAPTIPGFSALTPPNAPSDPAGPKPPPDSDYAKKLAAFHAAYIHAHPPKPTAPDEGP